jgi:hypothetical protein
LVVKPGPEQALILALMPALVLAVERERALPLVVPLEPQL